MVSSNRRSKGFTLVEIAMVLAVAALIIAGIMMFYLNSSRDQKNTESLEELSILQQTIRGMYAGQGNYVGLNRNVIAASKMLPEKWASPQTGVIKHPFGYYVDISVVTAISDGTFAIQFDQIPDAACMRMVTMDLGKELSNLYVTGPSVTSPGIVGRSMTPLEAKQYCVNNNRNDISWWFK